MTKSSNVALGAVILIGMLGVRARAAEPIKIGAIFSVTGAGSFLGEPERNTAKMLEAEINKAGGLLGRKVKIIVYDDETDAAKAATAFERLVQKDHVVAVVGPTTTGNTLAILSKVEEAKIPLISVAAAKRIVSPVKKWVFKTPQSDELAVKAILKHAKKAGITKLAILTALDGFGAAGREELKLLAQEYGITVVSDEVFGPRATDMTAQLTRIRGSDAQAIVCWGTNPGPAVIAGNRLDLGMKIPLYMSHGVASKKFIELAGADAAEGIVLPAGRLIVEDQVDAKHPLKKVLAAYVKDYQSKFKQEISTFGGHAWDAFSMLFEAIKIGKSTEPAAIRDNLEKIKKFYGTGGEFNLSPEDHMGLTDEAFVMVKITQGDWDLIK